MSLSTVNGGRLKATDCICVHRIMHKVPKSSKSESRLAQETFTRLDNSCLRRGKTGWS